MVGMFLIYNTIAASVVRRRVETGILRSMGATRAEVQALFLGEAALFGVIGVALGIVGGVCLARFLLGREIAKVISTLYLLVSVETVFSDAAPRRQRILLRAWVGDCRGMAARA